MHNVAQALYLCPLGVPYIRFHVLTHQALDQETRTLPEGGQYSEERPVDSVPAYEAENDVVRSVGNDSVSNVQALRSFIYCQDLP